MADPFAAVNNAMILGSMYGPNQYSQFQGRIPFPGYVGTPTDALGRPIQQTPGTTLNSTPAALPAAAAAPPATGAPDYSTSNPAYANYLKGHPAGSQMTAGGQIPSGGSSAAPTNVPATMMPGIYGQSPAAAPQSPGAAPGSLNNALAALSNPGPVTTPGATVPESSVGSQPSVLQQFLANKQGGTGAGNYSNAGFFDTLNALGKA
jgi:hypothetical protein